MRSGIDLVCPGLRRADTLAHLDSWIEPVRGNRSGVEAVSMMIDVPIRGIGPELEERMTVRGLSAAPKARWKEE
jgi:hypothetical protein